MNKGNSSFPLELNALAKQAGATFYTNRFYKDTPAVAFSPASWERFKELMVTPPLENKT